MERSRRTNRFTPKHITTRKAVPGVLECHEDLLVFRRGRRGDREASSTYKHREELPTPPGERGKASTITQRQAASHSAARPALTTVGDSVHLEISIGPGYSRRLTLRLRPAPLRLRFLSWLSHPDLPWLSTFQIRVDNEATHYVFQEWPPLAHARTNTPILRTEINHRDR
ncbi:hypothetical protein BGY98DRAFT_1126723 [Russula aff. rugulosa BPL654]|nr:hypothetical protein BGY98DRAFT_1126723 [Russula aff. rugulosa BPL654]